MIVPHPIPYQGSKRNLAPFILNCFPDRVERLVEPFAGSAAVSLSAAQNKRASEFWLNDAHAPLVDLWREIVEAPEELAGAYEELWNSQLGREREYFDAVRDQFNETQQPHHFLYLLARCVKAAIRYNGDGQFNNTPDNRRLGARPQTMRDRILGASGLLRKRCTVTALDYSDVLRDCDETDLIYMDPPYQGVCGVRDHRYAPKVDHRAFCDQLSLLNQRGCLYIVSYDGRTGDKSFGEPMPKTLRLMHIELIAGRSTQATLLGRNETTYEALYLSPALVCALNNRRKSSVLQPVTPVERHHGTQLVSPIRWQ